MTDFNPSRVARLKELTTDCQGIVTESKTLYKSFLTDIDSLNKQLAAVYKHANLEPPASADYAVLQGNQVYKNVAQNQKEVRVADIVIDMVGAGAMIEMAPAATACLLDAGLLTEAEASIGIMAALGTDITVGGMLGGILGALAVAVVGGAIAGAIGGFSHQSNRHDLQGAIVALKRTRMRAETSRQKLHCIEDVLVASKDACDTLMSMDVLDESAIKGLIEKQANPAITRLNKVGKASAIDELYDLDVGRNSWMQDG